ncbi:MAG: ribonuclease H-like domain-containing protein [Betaproteobacteria bacterium]
MDSSRLTDRLRAIISPAGATPVRPMPGPAAGPSGGDALEQVLGGEWQEGAGDRCFVVERSVEPARAYGSTAVGGLAAQMAEAAAAAPLLAAGAESRPPFLFFDLETTGLSGGAGTLAFLVGCGWFDERGGFATRQYVLTRHADEPALLRAVCGEFARAGLLVSFNGRSFDAPMLEARCLFHRLRWNGRVRPHLDVLHPARRFWGARATREAENDCSLAALERRLFGIHRAGDVSGAEAPARYFAFVRTGDARPLAGVLDHNRQDLLSLAALTVRLLRLAHRGHAEASHPEEALALGRLYARAGLDAAACDALRHAVTIADSMPRGRTDAMRASSKDAGAAVKLEALRALALALRRARRYDEAAACWQRMLDMPFCPPHFLREANQALAVHHEHRARDLAAAKTFALRTLEAGLVRESWTEAARHRLARIERKLGFLE